MIRFVVGLVFLLLASCGGGEGGGGGVGSGGTGINAGGVSIGSVSGFGSIIVNDVRYNVDTAALSLDDANSLALGMTVRVAGAVSADSSTGTATSVMTAAEMRGTVSAINAGSGTFVVLGTTVSTDEATVVDGVAGLASLVNGDAVQVYGLPAAPGSLRATRIEKSAAGSGLVVTGSVVNLDSSSRTFQLGGLAVNYAGAGLSDGLVAGNLTNGMLVRVRAAAEPVSGVLAATQLQPWYSIPSTNRTPVNLAGVVTDYASLSSFKLLGTSIDASAALVTGGPGSSVGNGVKLEVSGVMPGGVLRAATLKIKHIPGTGGLHRLP
ncbi:MAG: DUF5666 domain-containing protein [Burkholderiaceae bacterium]